MATDNDENPEYDDPAGVGPDPRGGSGRDASPADGGSLRGDAAGPGEELGAESGPDLLSTAGAGLQGGPEQRGPQRSGGVRGDEPDAEPGSAATGTDLPDAAVSDPTGTDPVPEELAALFAMALADEPPSRVTAESVLAEARRGAHGEAVGRLRGENRVGRGRLASWFAPGGPGLKWAGGVVVAAALVVGAVVVAPTLGGHGTATSSADSAAMAAAAGSAGPAAAAGSADSEAGSAHAEKAGPESARAYAAAGSAADAAAPSMAAPAEAAPSSAASASSAAPAADARAAAGSAPASVAASAAPSAGKPTAVAKPSNSRTVLPPLTSTEVRRLEAAFPQVEVMPTPVTAAAALNPVRGSMADVLGSGGSMSIVVYDWSTGTPSLVPGVIVACSPEGTCVLVSPDARATAALPHATLEAIAKAVAG